MVSETINNLLIHTVKQQEQIDQLLEHSLKQQEKISDLNEKVDELRGVVEALAGISAATENEGKKSYYDKLGCDVNLKNKWELPLSLDYRVPTHPRFKLHSSNADKWKTDRIIDCQRIINGCALGAKANYESCVASPNEEDSPSDWNWGSDSRQTK